jgi:hypothetical protein
MNGSAHASRMRESVVDFDVGSGGVSRLHETRSNCDRGLSTLLSQYKRFWGDGQLTGHTRRQAFDAIAWSSTLQWTLWSLSLHRDT